MSRVMERSNPERRTSSVNDKPTTRFVANLLKKKAITAQEAEVLGMLTNPHLQFEALQRYRRSPDEGLAAHVQAVRTMQVKHEEAAISGGKTGDSLQSVLGFFWQLSRQASPSGRSIAVVLAVCVAVLTSTVFWRKLPQMASWWQFRAAAKVTSTAVPIAISASTDAAANSVNHASASTEVAPIVTPPAVPAQTPARAFRTSGPHNLAIHPAGNQMMQLTWDALDDSPKYHLYSATNPDMDGAKLEDEAAIPVNWYNWMPPSNAQTLWFAVKGIASSGRETRFSNILRVDVSGQIIPSTPVAPPTPAPTATPVTQP